MTNHYDILGIPKTASEDDVRTAYRKLARKNHPDKGGDKDTFQKIQTAYETLSDPNKRSAYDNPNSMANDFPFDFNHSFFRHHHRHKKHVKRADHLYTCRITLRDVFFGTTKRLKIQRSRLCKKCLDVCRNCNGKGVTVQQVQMGPFSQIIQHSCNVCNSSGKIRNASLDCSECRSTGKCQEDTIFEIVITKATETNKKCVLPEWGEQPANENETAGDFIVTIVIEDDPVFQRSGTLNLKYTTTLSLRESFVGKVLNIPHFAGDIHLDTRGFGIINPNKEYIIYNKGLINESGDTGNMYIRFKIDYPERNFNGTEIDLLTETFNKVHL